MSKLVLTGFCSSSPQQNHQQNKKKVVVTDFMFVVVCEMEVAKIQYHNIEYRNKTFEIDYTLRYFKSVCWHQQPPDNQTIKNWHQVSMQFWKIWSTRFFGTQLRGDQNLLFTVGGFFFNKREYSGDDWLDPLIQYVTEVDSWIMLKTRCALFWEDMLFTLFSSKD